MYARIETESVLYRAAAEKHPGWNVDDSRRHPEKIDDNATEWPELIDWFRKCFPHEAAANEPTTSSWSSATTVSRQARE